MRFGSLTRCIAVGVNFFLSMYQTRGWSREFFFLYILIEKKSPPASRFTFVLFRVGLLTRTLAPQPCAPQAERNKASV